MYRRILRRIKKGSIFGQGTSHGIRSEINPEDIFLDAANLPGYDEHRFEGRIERPMSSRTFMFMKVAIVIVVSLLGYKLWVLGIKDGPVYAQISENNRLSHTLVFANRGVIYDRNDFELAGNAIREEGSDFAARTYASLGGLSHVVGYVKYPKADRAGNYYEENYKGHDGVERLFDSVLAGVNGLKLVETDVLGKVTSESVIERPVDGKPVKLSIDGHVSNQLYTVLEQARQERGFQGAAAVIMDVQTGEVLSLVSAPEYDQEVITEGRDSALISSEFNNPSKPFLNRVVGGLYSPGSIVKPIIALGALNEGLISPSKQIYSAGSISIPNPYNPSNPSVFGDWKAHGWTDMRRAIAVSSDVYFYSIGGGYGDQKGMGIEKIDRYLNLFGLTEKTGIELLGEVSGTIPTPEWKMATFDGDPWRLGDTYITSIGQYGTLVTPLEAVRFTAAIANKGKLLVPSVLHGGTQVPKERLDRSIEFSDADWQIVRAGMRDCVSAEGGTCAALNVPYVKVAAKTGTAEIGAGKNHVHSWSVGFFPYDNPRYAFAVLLDRGPSTNTLGATSVMRQLLDWMSIHTPQYLE